MKHPAAPGKNKSEVSENNRITQFHCPMKKTIALSFLLLLTGLALYLGGSVLQKQKQHKATEEKRRTLPAFTFQDLRGKPFSHTDLPGDEPLLLVYFHSDCSYCQYEAALIRDSLHLLAGVQILLISDEAPEQIRSFGEAHDLLDQPGLLLLHDPAGEQPSVFNTGVLPSVFVYDRRRRLVRYFKGETKLETLLACLLPAGE